MLHGPNFMHEKHITQLKLIKLVSTECQVAKLVEENHVRVQHFSNNDSASLNENISENDKYI